MTDFLIWIRDTALMFVTFPGIIFTLATITICCGIYEYSRCKRMKEEKDEEERRRKETLDNFN